MEISNLPDKEFKESVIRIIKKLENRMQKFRENFNKKLESIRKKQVDLKNTITEMKNALEGIKSRLTNIEEQIKLGIQTTRNQLIKATKIKKE